MHNISHNELTTFHFQNYYSTENGKV